MATKKKLLQAAAGTAAASGGAAGLNVEDVFSTYLYDGNGSSQVIENGVKLGQSNSGGGIYFPDGDGDYLQTATLPALSGEFTIDLWFYSYDSDRAIYLIGNGVNEDNFMVKTDYLTTSGSIYIKVAGTSVNGNASSYYDIDGWNHLAITRNASNVVSCYVNGSRISTATISGSLNSTTYNIGTVGGGAASASGYELMYGYMSSVRISDTARYDPTSASITVPTSAFTSDSNTVLLLGQGDTPLADASSNSYSVTVNGNPRASEVGPFDAADAGEGGLVWIKNRTGADNHWLADTERGTSVVVSSSGTFANVANNNRFVSFNSNGFSLGNNGSVNGGTYDYASWTFRKAPKFFDVVTATAPSSGTLQVSHNLGTTVGCIILKSTSDADNWVVYHRGMGANYYATMNQTNPWINVTGVFDGVTDTYFTLDPSKNCTAGRTYVAYVFAHNDGDGTFGPTGDQDVISCGSFTSDSNGDISVELGWEPQFVLYRRTDQGGVWIMTDTMRGMSVNGGTNINYLAANASNVEANNATGVYPTPTGIGGNFNASANTPAIYIAIRRGPMAVPTDATDVFAIDATYSATSPQYYTGWPVDFWMRYYDRGSSTDFAIAMDRLRGNGTKYLNTSSQNGETNFSTIGLAQMEGADLNGISASIAWLWRRAPKFFDIVAYEGNQTADYSVSHNLQVAPELVITKSRSSSSDWGVYTTALGNNTNWLKLNSTDAVGNGTGFMYVTDTELQIDPTSFADAGADMIAYLFASLDNVSKVGSFSHTSGTPTDVDCGFTSGARFVLWKKTDSTDGWQVYDTTRGIVTGNDPFLQLNSTAAEITGEDLIDPLSSGFTVSANKNSGTYIFYAIA